MAVNPLALIAKFRRDEGYRRRIPGTCYDQICNYFRNTRNTRCVAWFIQCRSKWSVYEKNNVIGRKSIAYGTSIPSDYPLVITDMHGGINGGPVTMDHCTHDRYMGGGKLDWTAMGVWLSASWSCPGGPLSLPPGF
jgi:hypothetical protein